MTVQQAIDMLMDVENKNITLVIPSHIGFIAACELDSKITVDIMGEQVFAMFPCFCKLPDDGLNVEFKIEENFITAN